MAEHMRAELVVEALEMAVWLRKPAPGLIHHSDRGGAIRRAGLRAALRPGRHQNFDGPPPLCAGQGVAESFFASLKKELIRRRSWPTRRDASSAIFNWIEGWYNRRRMHSALNYQSPADYESRTLTQIGASLAASRLASIDRKIKDEAA